MLSASAPMQNHVIQWFRAVLGTHIIEGYGQTESSAGGTSYLIGDTVPGNCSHVYLCLLKSTQDFANQVKWRSHSKSHVATGHAGVPGPGWEIKLIDVPEMNYFVRDNKGEVCMKGPGVFKVSMF